MNIYKSICDTYSSKYGEISSGYFEDRKSKFYCYVFNISNSNNALDYIDKVKQDNKYSRHVIYIYSVFENNELKVKFSDDGEPQGTGTKAIYDILTRDKISNICIVIVRYFGGILLGAGPLARAYLNSFRDALVNLKIDKLLNYKEYSFNTNYSKFDKLKQIISMYEKDSTIIVDSILYNDIIQIKLRIEESKYESVISELS